MRGRRLAVGFAITADPSLADCLLLVGHRALRALAGASVGVGALAADREALAVTDALQAADLDLALDVALDVAAQVAFDLQVLVDVGADAVDLVLGEVRDLRVRVEFEFRADLLRRGQTDPEDVGERDLQPLLAGDVDAGDTCHVITPVSPDAACGAGWGR